MAQATSSSATTSLQISCIGLRWVLSTWSTRKVQVSESCRTGVARRRHGTYSLQTPLSESRPRMYARKTHASTTPEDNDGRIRTYVRNDVDANTGDLGGQTHVEVCCMFCVLLRMSFDSFPDKMRMSTPRHWAPTRPTPQVNLQGAPRLASQGRRRAPALRSPIFSIFSIPENISPDTQAHGGPMAHRCRARQCDRAWNCPTGSNVRPPPSNAFGGPGQKSQPRCRPPPIHTHRLSAPSPGNA